MIGRPDRENGFGGLRTRDRTPLAILNFAACRRGDALLPPEEGELAMYYVQHVSWRMYCVGQHEGGWNAADGGKGGSRIAAGEGEREGEGVCAPPSASPWLGSLFSGLTCRPCGANGTAREDPLVFGSGDRNSKWHSTAQSCPGSGWLGREASKQDAGEGPGMRVESGKWKVVLSRSLAHCAAPSSRIAPELRVASCELRAGAHTTHRPVP